jgi:hypothetical protein
VILILSKTLLLPDISIIMKKLFWIVSSILLIGVTVIFAIAVTNNSPSNPFKKYSIVILIGGLAISGFVRIAYRKLYK